MVAAQAPGKPPDAAVPTSFPVRSALLAVSAAYSLGGCVVARDAPPAAAGTFARAAFAADAAFAYETAPSVELSPPVETTRWHDVHELSFATSGRGPGHRVEAVYYRSRTPGAHKLVVVLPVWGRSEYPPSRISRGYARRSRGAAHVIRIRGEAPLFAWDEMSSAGDELEFAELAEHSTERFRTAVVDLRRLLGWAGTRREIDTERIGLIGFSMSALVAATLLGNDARVDAAVLMLGAANYAEVFSRCGDKAGEVRRHALDDLGWSGARYRAFFAELFGPADPVRFAGRYDPSSILLLDARFDDCMPRSTRDALWHAMGRPERVTLWLRHRSAFYSLTPLGLNFGRRRIFDFLDRKL